MDASESSPTSSDSSLCDDQAWRGRGVGRREEILPRLNGRGAARRAHGTATSAEPCIHEHGVGSEAPFDESDVGVACRSSQPYQMNSIALELREAGVLLPEMEPIAEVIRRLVGA